MPAPEERINLNDFSPMTVMGMDDSGKEKPVIVLVRRDRSLVTWSRQVAFNGTREQIILSDAQNLVRERPYEPIFPVEPTLLTGTLATVFTATSARVELWCDVLNSGNADGVTVRVQRRVAASGQDYDWYPTLTPVMRGVPIRTGFIQLASGDSLRASCNPASMVTIHPHVHRYNATGDTP